MQLGLAAYEVTVECIDASGLDTDHEQEQGSTATDYSETQLDPTLREIAAFYAASAQAKGVDIELEADSSAHVYGNPRRLTLIFGNLLDNADKYAEPGTPTAPALGPEHWIEPEPGMLVLFPAYMWHGTAPFSSDGTRLTCAFDLVRA